MLFIVPHLVWLVPLGFLTFVYWYIRNQFSFWTRHGVPFTKPHWFFGNIGDWLLATTSINMSIKNIYQEFKNEKFCGIWRFYSPTLFVIDPEMVSNILVKDSTVWSTRGLPISSDKDPLSASLVNVDGDEWKWMRSNSSPAYTPVKLKQMFESLLECGKGLKEYLDTRLMVDDGVVEAGEMCKRFVTDVNGLCVFGIRLNSLNEDSLFYSKLKKDIVEISLWQQISLLMQIVSTRLYKFFKLKLQSSEMTNFFLNIVKESLEYRDQNKIHNHDFLGLLKDLQGTGKPRTDADDKRLAAQAFDFFLGAFQSTSRAIGYALHELAVNQEVQDRLRKEMRITKAKDNGKTTWHALNNMKYLDMVVQETLRKYPIPTLFRKSVNPYRIPDTNVVLPSGTMCFIPVYAIHHDPKYYPDPEKFDPERFTNEAKNQRPACTFLSFGLGPRNCIGLRFGEHQVKMALITVLENFEISLCEKSQNPLEFRPRDLFLDPKYGIWLRFVKNSSDDQSNG